jgi:hypothetical protein
LEFDANPASGTWQLAGLGADKNGSSGKSAAFSFASGLAGLFHKLDYGVGI